ncbi:MAG: GntR family transcriptional regulator [Chloroflexi bacterium]|nr:GntR family transcriptional regulator [Chloroflexota bacterium]
MDASAAAVSDRLAALAPTRSSLANAADSVYQTLREAIVGGQLEPGDSLIEWHVARQFGTSRTPVREALLRLETEGLAFRVPRRGLVVRQISEHEIHEVYAVRTALEALAAREAANEAMPSDISQLRWVNQRLGEAIKQADFASVPALTNEFHQALANAAHNSMLLRFIVQAQDWTRRVGTPTVSLPGRRAAAVREHARMIDAIAARDADTAERLAREHMATGREFQLATLRKPIAD